MDGLLIHLAWYMAAIRQIKLSRQTVASRNPSHDCLKEADAIKRDHVDIYCWNIDLTC